MTSPLLDQAPNKSGVYIDFLDVTRTLSIFCIVCYHYAHHMEQRSFFDTLFSGARVPVMLMVAAYFFQSKNIIRWRNRLLSMLLTYLIWELIYISTFLPLGVRGWETWHEGVWWCFSHTFLLHEDYPINGAAWFLRILIIYTLLAPLLEKLGSWLLPSALLLLIGLHVYFAYAPQEHLIVRQFLGIAYYMMGLALRQLDRQSIIGFVKRSRWVFLPLYIILYAFTLGHWQLMHRMEEVMVFLGIMAMVSLSSYIVDYLPFLKRAMKRLSAASYFIFMAHYLFIYSFVQLALPSLQKYCPALFARGNSTVLIVGMLCFATCYCVWVLGQRFFPRAFDYLGAFPIGRKYRPS